MNTLVNKINELDFVMEMQCDIYRGAGKSLARPTSRCILFYGENTSFDASLVVTTFLELRL